MGQTVVEVVKVVAPVALQTLAEAAGKLISGQARSTASFAKLNDQSNGGIIFADTVKYVNDQFSSDYRYFYKGAGSKPPFADPLVPIIGASEDIMVWDPSKNSNVDIKAYMQKVFKDTLPDSDAIEVAENISDLFEARFTEVDLSWSPFSKRYNMSGTPNYIIDLEMVTAAGYDENNKPLGIATYCFVGYALKSK